MDNSGNVIFSSNEDNIAGFTNRIEIMIKRRFGFDIPVFVIAKEALEDILYNAPDWWGNGDEETYDNLIRKCKYQQQADYKDSKYC